MRIAIVSFGHVDVVLPLFKHLKASSIDVDLYLCFSLNRKAESILDFSDESIITGFTNFEKTEELLAQEIKNYLGNISNIRFFIFHNLKLRSIWNFRLSKMLSDSLKPYDIIHFNGTNGVLPILIYFLGKKKLIFTIHDIYSHYGEKTRFNFAEKMNRYVIKSKYSLIVQNLKDYKFLNQKYPKSAEKLKFIPFGVLDVYHEFSTITTKAPFSDLLFFGRISQYKGIEYLISALEILKEQGILYTTIIAGNGEVYFDTGKIKELGILLINRYIPNSELVSLIKNTKIVVCPYTDATQSGVLMTAFAFNKPVIASYVGSFPEVIKDGINGFLVPPKDPNALASKIAKVISDPVLLIQMQNNIQSITTSGEYSWSQIVMKMQDLYASTLSNRHKN